jgi:ankyrin repeat protein
MSISKIHRQRNDALIRAVIKDDPIAVRTALANGADPNCKWEPPSSAGCSVLILAVNRQNTAVVAELLKASNIDVNIADKKGKSALAIATFVQMTDIMELLLRHPNIDMNKADERKRTAWDYARINVTEKTDVVRGLLAKHEGLTWTEGKQKRGKSPNQNIGQ